MLQGGSGDILIGGLGDDNYYVESEGATLIEVITNLEAAHPGFSDRLLDESGALRKFVNLFVADDDVRYLDGLSTPTPEGSTISIIPAVAGG